MELKNFLNITELIPERTNLYGKGRLLMNKSFQDNEKFSLRQFVQPTVSVVSEEKLTLDCSQLSNLILEGSILQPR